MKTLLEQVINELKISKAVTGKKLEPAKTFGDLTPGDYFFLSEYDKDKGLKIHTYVVQKLEPLAGLETVGQKFTIDGNERNKKHLDTNVFCKNVDNGEDFQFTCISDAHYISLGADIDYFHKFASINAVWDFVKTFNVKVSDSAKQKLNKMGLIK